MNNEDLLEAIGSADEKLLEQSERRKTKPVRTLATIAAVICVCMLLSEVVGLLIPSHRVTKQTISWNLQMETMQQESSGSNAGASTSWDWAKYQYLENLSIEAKVVEVLPDTYDCLGDSRNGNYHVLRLKVLDEIVGDHFPKEIYYLLPVTYDADLTEYDSLILNVAQLGVENYWMYNADQNRLEVFDFVFRYHPWYPLEYGSVIAYKDGKMDVGLWDKEGWSKRKQKVLYYVESEEYPFPVKRNLSISEAKEQIRLQSEQYFEDNPEKREHFIAEVKTVDSYRSYLGAGWFSMVVKPIFGGVYAQYLQTNGVGNGELVYRRMINGFFTNEYIYFTKHMEYGIEIATRPFYNWVRFTHKDLKKLPDMEYVIENLETILPEMYLTEEYKERFLGVTGTYYKVGDVVYGVVEARWKKGWNDLICYILVLQDGSHRIVTSEELNDIIPAYGHSGMVPYD